ncbi:hypothetical protein SPBR_00392 [Sporothrix brasiliensis 5110]|uniref:Zn(2)-C6 fungal-type domain-containing protein n=1 Tax=Sporothrix brasiliensis 5110 TaxID=1398154 RepID=A0A0C2IYB0_9PEZI|nr:uncharacterized protein SPBR_00392 [Sporothrix brasiliensis 5110]KIH90002.1 hypothetical protein SPBR_00392 [Sporothrix brasiliensis 5110]
MPQHSRLSCWTCRLRKKKCDRTLPLCSNCRGLGLSCRNGDETRPGWMEGGKAQEQHALVIRAQIKEHQVRERSLVAQHRRAQKQQRRSDGRSELLMHEEAWDTSAAKESRPAGATSHSSSSQASSSSPVPASAAFAPPGQSYISADFTVMYLDYVFPFLFPHYRPTIFEGGRAWVLATLQTQKPLYHTAMSLASFFLALITQTPSTSTSTPQSPSETSLTAQSHTTLQSFCGGFIWDILGQHMDEASRAVRAVIDRIPRAPADTALVPRTRLLVNIVQLQVFETAMGTGAGTGTGTGTRGIHLRAATEVFDGIVRQYDSLGHVLASLDSSFSEALQGTGWRIWNIDQAAFRFAASALLYMDIVESTTRQGVPHLRTWYPRLVAQADGNTKDTRRLRMEDVVGCQGWMLMVISEIAVLANWAYQGSERNNGDLGRLAELHARSHNLSWRIHDGLRYLTRDTESATSPLSASTSASAASPPPVLQAYYRPDSGAQLQEQAQVTRIWAYAGLLYLETVTRKCACDNCASKSHKENATTVLALLQQVTLPAVLRGLNWPIFVTGFMATVEQRAEIRNIVATAGPLQKFGGLASTLHHLEELWNRPPQQHNEPPRTFRESVALLADSPVFM